jgi:hypothetical protein
VPIGLLTPVKGAIGRWVAGFHAQAYRDTPAMAGWAARPAADACKWAEGRMVDDVEAMLSSVRNNANAAGPSTNAFSPMLLVAVATEYTETPSDAGVMPLESIPVVLPNDPLNRVIAIDLMSVDLRCQVAMLASEQATVMSMCAQMGRWAAREYRLTAWHAHEAFGLVTEWPVRVVPVDRMAIHTPVGEHMKIMTLDLTIRAVLPMFRGPGAGDDTDGESPPGFAVISEVQRGIGLPPGVTEPEWMRYLGAEGSFLRPVVDAPPASAGGPARMPGDNRAHDGLGVVLGGVGQGTIP